MKRWLFLTLSLFFVCAGSFFAKDTVETRELIIYRPSNYSEMDMARCFLRVEDADGNEISLAEPNGAGWANYSWYYEPKIRRPYQKSWYLSGGMAMHLHLKEGTYKLSVYTPVEQQGMWLTNLDIPQKEWKSEVFTYNTDDTQLKVIFVSPTADENGFYNGGWHIDYRAPKFYKYTKPYQATGRVE